MLSLCLTTHCLDGGVLIKIPARTDLSQSSNWVKDSTVNGTHLPFNPVVKFEPILFYFGEFKGLWVIKNGNNVLAHELMNSKNV